MQTLDFTNIVKIERSSKRKRIFFRWLLFLILGLFALYYIAPLYVMIVTSLKTMDEIDVRFWRRAVRRDWCSASVRGSLRTSASGQEI